MRTVTPDYWIIENLWNNIINRIQYNPFAIVSNIALSVLGCIFNIIPIISVPLKSGPVKY